MIKANTTLQFSCVVFHYTSLFPLNEKPKSYSYTRPLTNIMILFVALIDIPQT